MKRAVFVLGLLTLGVGFAACGRGDGGAGRVRLATTTSTRDSGLLDHLLPPFEAETGLRVDVIGVGTGKALALGRRGDADLVMVHARALEDAFVQEGHGIDRHDLMHNDFVILGPASDPAGIRGTADAAAALLQVRQHGARFVSRGDNSGTHVRELALWKAAGGLEAWDDYLEAGDGMGPCLTIADEKQAYILADRGTWLARKAHLALEVLVEGDPGLENPYGVILVNPARHPHVNARGARRLLDYLVSPEGQARIGTFRLEGKQLFHPARAK